MHRAQPVSSRVLSKKWEEMQQMIHYEKLKHMKPTVDSKRPATFTHLKHKAKREQLMEGTV